MKKKKIRFCTFILISLISFLMLRGVWNMISGKSVPLSYTLFHRNLDYQKNIEIKAYILAKEQLDALMDQPTEELIQPSMVDLCLKDTYLVLRLKNHGDKEVFGRISYNYKTFVWFKLDLSLAPTNNQNPLYRDIIISGMFPITSNKNEPPPPIKYKWDAIYTKKAR